ncbi:MAG: hypothetical protein AB7F43_10280 [Bacteriovoracia bacterium]
MKKRLLTALCISLLLFGCLNSAPSSSDSTSSSLGTSEGTLPNGNTVTLINITKVVRSNQDPNSLIELVGNSGEIGTYCPTVQDCQCQFDFIENGTLRRAMQVPSLVEVDLMRCSFAQVSPLAKYYDVRIFVNAGGSTSNSMRVNITSSNPNLDSSIATNYTQTTRFQCHDFITKSQNTKFYGANLLDPQLWDLSQAYNFYTTSLGKDYGAIAEGQNSSVSGFECPVIPTGDTNSSGIDNKLYSIDPVNIDNPSQTGLSSGDITIFPSNDNIGAGTTTCPTGKEKTCEQFTINRHDFYLANFKDAIFKMPFCSIHRVSNISGTTSQLRCDVPATGGPYIIGSDTMKDYPDVIGFAAVPDANEKCPDSTVIKIPTNKKWAKVWRFRVSIPPRAVNDLVSNETIGFLACTNRTRECTNFDNAVTWDSVCHHLNFGNTLAGSGFGVGAVQQQIFLPGGLAFGNCSSSGTQGDNLTNGSTYTNAGTACSGANGNCCQDLGPGSGVGAANYTPGGDWCNPALAGSTWAVQNGGLASDNWLMGTGSRKACIEADTDINGKLPYAPLSTLDPLGVYSTSIRYLDSAPKVDTVYVVTPASVTMQTMTNPDSNVAKQYTPYRFLIPGDPNSKLFYRFEAGSINSSDPILRLSRFPLCVLQDTQ